MPADSIGLQKGDLIVAVDGDTITSWEHMADVIHAKPGQIIEIEWMRQDTLKKATLKTTSNEIILEGERRVIGLIGVGPLLDRRPVGLLEAIENGAKSTIYIAGVSIISLKMLITGKAGLKDIVGPVGILHYSGESARSGAATFFGFIALISINIGFLNILPIPALDGGHLVYIIIESIIRRPIPTKIKIIIQQVGMALLLLLILIVSYNDIVKFFLK